jgi:hypothetical protein
MGGTAEGGSSVRGAGARKMCTSRRIRSVRPDRSSPDRRNRARRAISSRKDPILAQGGAEAEHGCAPPETPLTWRASGASPVEAV